VLPMARFYFSVCLAALLFCPLARAQSKFDCPNSRNYQRPHRFSGYVAQILPESKPSAYHCRGTVLLPSGARRIVARDAEMSLDAISGTDINGDHIPEVVFDGFSARGSCCYSYWIVRLEKPPQLIREIDNQVPLVFRKRADGDTEIRTGEGSFDEFLLPHSDAVIPELILQMEGKNLKDISSQYQEEYDQRIAQARSELTAADLEKFRHSNYHQRMFADQLPTLKCVLTIILNYLYSGREQLAWQALDNMWPPSDNSRVKQLIRERRARGLASRLAGE